MAVRKRIADNDPSDPRDDLVEAPMAPRRLTVGETLRNRRIECRLELGHVAEVLRIRAATLTAIEDDAFDRLPGPAYAVGFVRAYAGYLGLDADAIVARFKAESGGAGGRPSLAFPLPVSDSRVPTGPLLVICMLLAVLVYGGWYFFGGDPARLTAMVTPVPDRLRHMLDGAPAANTADAPVAPPQAPATSNSPAAQPAQSTAPVQSAQKAAAPPVVQPPTGSPAPAAVDGAPPVETAAAPPAIASTLPAAPDIAQPATADAKPASASTYGATDGDARVVLRANSDSWIQIRDRSGALLFTRILKSGESYKVPNQSGLLLVAGNAGGLDVAVDGVDVPHLGDPGRVVRNVSLDPDHLLGGIRHAN